MIRTKNELNSYLSQDLARRGGYKPSLKDFLLRNESWYLWRFTKSLRYMEYYKNQMGGG